MGDSTVLVFDDEVAKAKLRGIWGDVLDLDPSLIEDDDSFFDLGGDSILAHDVVLAAEQQGLLLDMRTVFLSTSFKEMSEAVMLPSYDPDMDKEKELGDLGQTTDEPPNDTPVEYPDSTNLELARACGVSISDIEQVYRCSPIQESLMTDIDGHRNPYVLQCVFALERNTPLTRFQLAWDETVRANPILRTRVCHSEPSGSFLNVVVDDKPLWTEETTDLAQYLDRDAALPMKPGDAFFRYCIVTDASDEDQRHFVWTAHHALCDADSLENIIVDVARRYQGQALPERPSFHKFVDSIYRSPTIDEQENFWKRSLGNAEPAIYPPAGSKDGDLHPALTGFLEWPLSLPRTPPSGLTTALLLRAAWAVLISRYTGSNTIAFDVVNNGHTPAFRDVVGPTINVVPALVTVDPDASVTSFLSDVLVRAAKAMPFEHAGMSNIRKILADSGSAAVAAGQSRTLFVVQPAEVFTGAADAMRVLGLQYLEQVGKREKHPYPLVLTLTLLSNTSVGLRVQYDDRVLSKQAAGYLVHHYQQVLTGLAEATEENRMGFISPFCEYDMSHIRRWNEERFPSENTCVHHLFQRQAARQPSAVAIRSADMSLTYRDLDEMSTSLAVHLSQLGVAPGSRVGVCFEKSIWTAVSILAVFKAGAIYVPIERGHPKSRIEEVIALAQIELVMTSVASVCAMEAIDVKTVLVDKGCQRRRYSEEKQLPTTFPSSIAYILFTSGTTGKPKGIVMPHASICTSIKHHTAAFGMGPHTRTLQFGAHTFDLSIGEFFSTLAAGGCVCIPSEEERLEDLAGMITRLRVNTLLVVPTVLGLLDPVKVPTLETVVLAGEPIPQETVARWAGRVTLHCAYGPSETAVWCSGNLGVSPNDDAANIGCGIGANMWIVERGDHEKLAAVGCVGEILISGPLVGAGYLADETATAAAFVTAPDWLRAIDPTCGVVYKSGDLARYKFDGTMRIMGRTDAQVKLRGHRTELGEIESRVMEHGMITVAQAVVPAAGPFEGQLVVVFSSRNPVLRDAAPSSDIRISRDGFALVEDLRVHAALRLPDYMLPSAWIPAEEVPLLISGKIDRRQLRDWVQAMAPDSHAELLVGASNVEKVHVAPGSTADRIRHLWSDVLGIPPDRISANTPFLAVGGDSIAAIKVVAQGRKTGLQLSVRGLLGTKTLETLAVLSDNSSVADVVFPAAEENNTDGLRGTETLLPPFRASLETKLGTTSGYVVEDAYLLSPIQRVILRARTADPSLFVLSLKMEFKSRDSQPVSLGRLARAWEYTVARFPILRSVFFSNADGILDPIQVVLHGVRPNMYVVTAPQVEAMPTFDSVGAPSVDDCRLPHRALVLQHSDRCFICLEFDHLVIDGWSLQLVKTALMESYEADSPRGVLSQSPPYKDYVNAHSPDHTEADDKHWTSVLRGQKPSLLSLTSSVIRREPPPPDYHSAGPRKIFHLGQIEAESLSAFSTAHGVTPASIFDAAWAQTLGHYTGSPDVVFDYVLSCRDDAIVESSFDIVGPLLNVLPYHLSGVSAKSGAEALALLARRMQEQRMRDRQHARTDVAANAEKRRPAMVETGRWVLEEELESTRDPWHFDLLVRVLQLSEDNALLVYIEFDPHVFDSEGMRNVAGHYWNRIQVAVS
ncbi:non-ribosomal peptide synthetase module [Colletotrichum zoysiae]|uniref:Non-ribosomal peptide synthetase module n=1 Tax=Colletotrichum zoysiae TaxID=1216348 RepID=A0AAD9HEA4_9PEZI|nr:non-ribosomal peptide synthetase module [Colletotrichum zoysiae]